MTKFDVKIFGERNTATNALKIILENNSLSRVFPSTSRELESRTSRLLRRFRLRGRSSEPVDHVARAAASEDSIDRVFDGVPPTHAWKHAATYFDDVGAFRGSLVVFCVRNPLSWTFSLFRNPHNIKTRRPDNFAEFLEMDWPLLRRDNLPFEHLKPYQLYEEKVRSYSVLAAALKEKGITSRFVYFEDIVTEQEKVFSDLSPFLERPAQRFSALENSTKDRTKSADYYKRYYGEELWRKEIVNEIGFLSAKLDKQVFEPLGYRF